MTLLLLSPTAPPAQALGGIGLPDAIVTALIAASVSVLVAVLSAVLTRNKEHATWLREKSFATVTALSDAARDYHNALVVNGPHPKTELKYGTVLRLYDTHDWSSYEAARQRFDATLSDLAMLMNDAPTREHIANTRRAFRNLHKAARSVPKPQEHTHIIYRFEFNKRFIKEYRDYGRARQALVEHITETHFASRRGRWKRRLQTWFQWFKRRVSKLRRSERHPYYRPLPEDPSRPDD